MQTHDDLRTKSDALLKLCGKQDERKGLGDWNADARKWENTERPHPYESIDDAVRLAEAMGLVIWSLDRKQPKDPGYNVVICYTDRPKSFSGQGPTIAEAIAEAILAAVKDKEPA